MRQRVVVIGGGIAGASIGFELADRADVVLLEAEAALAVHSTGRSAALFITEYGPPAVCRVTKASEQMFADFEERMNTPPLLLPRGVLLTAWDDATQQELEGLVTPPDTRVRPVTIDEVRALCPTLIPDGLRLAAFDSTARDIDVSALHAGYIRGLRKRAGQVHVNARVVSLDRRSSSWHVSTADGRTWTADVVVNAAGAWGDTVNALCGVPGFGLVPCRRTVVIARTERRVDPGCPVVADAAEAWYFKPEGAGVLLSPGDETPTTPGDVRPDPLDIALVLDRVNAVTTLGLRSVTASWAGLRTFASDRCPVVGWHPDEPALFAFLGQGGFGIQMSPALATAAANLLMTGDRDSVGWSIDDFAPARFRTAGVPASSV